MLNPFNTVFLNYGFCIIVFSLTPDSRSVTIDNENLSLVEVRAVFINCRPNEGPASPDTEASRFEREELFKHNALKECNTKLALILKLSSLPEGNSDEYIPIDHVVGGPSKRRVRLLNPYVLRLRWENPVQAYKLQNMDTVTGVFEENDKRSVEKIHTKLKKDRVQRSTNQFMPGLAHSLGPTSLLTAGLNIDDYADSQLIASPFSSEHKIGLKESTDIENYLNASLLRNKRHQQNVVVESQIPEGGTWMSDFDSDVNEESKRASFDGKNVPHNQEVRENNFWKKTKNHLDKYIPQGGKFSQKHHSPPNKMSIQNSVSDGDAYRDKVSLKDNSKLDLDRQSFRDFLTSSERPQQAKNNIYSPNNIFSIYDIGGPDVWCVVHVQLFEKLTKPDGKTVWNDITKGETASVSSVLPEWRDQDLHIRYRSAEWTSQDQFTLPVSTNLCLLVPRPGDGDDIVSDSDFIIVPSEDVIFMDDDDITLHKRDENSSDAATDVSMAKHRKVLVRVARTIKRGIDSLNIVEQGSEHYLTLPHRRPHHIQIDVEIRADDNQLIRVGADGRLTTMVSDNSRRVRTVFTVQATNTGLAAAKFKIKTRDCGPQLSSLIQDQSSAGAETDLVLIPPRHTKRISLDLPVELPGDVAHCSIALINQDDESVAIRDVTIKRGDRCFCVWHCDCVCLSDDPKLLCREMSESRQAAAGLRRERARRTRNVFYPDCECVNVCFMVGGVLFVLLFLGVVKACIGLACPAVGSMFLGLLIELPRRLERYHENSLADRAVVFDRNGWPVHPDTGLRTVRVLSVCTEFFLNVIFFIAAPCLICWFAVNKFIPKSESWHRNSNPKTGISHANFQEELPRLRLRRTRRLRKWMTPEADDLSNNLWRQGLLPQRSFNCKFMKPLVNENDGRADGSHSSSADSELEDTEYVLTQMQKSRESLAKTQRMTTNTSPMTK